ncbi:hypothetical protein [Rhizobium yanglingense]
MADDRLPHEPRPVVVMSTTARILIAGPGAGLQGARKRRCPSTMPPATGCATGCSVERETFDDPERFAIVPMGFRFPRLRRQGQRPAAPARMRAALAPAGDRSAMPQIELDPRHAANMPRHGTWAEGGKPKP